MHFYLHHLFILDYDCYLRISWPQQTPVINVGWSDQHFLVIYYHKLTMDIDQFTYNCLLVYETIGPEGKELNVVINILYVL